MRSLICHIVCLFFPVIVMCQNLGQSPRRSLTARIYQITNEQALDIYKLGVWGIDSTYFQQFIDEYHADSIYRKNLPHGQYLHVKSIKDQLHIKLETSSDLQTYIFNNGKEAKIEVQNSKGLTIENAELRFGSRKLRFDNQSKSYILKGTKRQGVLSVTYNGNTTYQTIDWYGAKLQFKYLPGKILRSRPLRYIWMPVRDGVRSITYGEEVGYISSIADWFRPWGDKWNKEYEDKFSGYLLFNKPVFRPGDTVKLKAFIMDKKGHPIHRDLEVRVSGRKIDKVLGNPRTHLKGAYTFEFVLDDSLNLKIDQTYKVSLELKKYKGLISDDIKIEHYELKSTNYSLRVAHKQHISNESNAVFMEGKDANNFNLLDGRYKLLLRTNDVMEFSLNKVFIPDTLWFHEGKLDPFGETRVNIPSEIFPKAKLTYDVEAIFLNTENEQHTKTEYVAFHFGSKKIDMRIKDDSLLIDYLIDSISQKVDATLKSDVSQTESQNSKISLPIKIKIRQNVENYTVQFGDLTSSLSMQSEDAQIQCNTSRTQDSLFVNITSGRGLDFKYDVFYGQKKISSGSGKHLDFQAKTKGRKNYFISVQYLWAGKEISKYYDIPFYNKELDIRLITPSTVFPGQKASIKVLATEKSGAPAKNADISVTGITSKFKFDRIPSLYYYGKNYAPYVRRIKYKKNAFFNSNQNKKMNFPWWELKLHLDTMAYYNFLYPKNGFYKKLETVSDSSTQFSPFVVKNGILQPVHVIYLDGRPIYFRGVNALERYSFSVDSGYHKIKLRTAKSLITIDSLYFTNNKKLIFNVDLVAKNKGVFVEKMPGTLTEQELVFLSKYMALVARGFRSKDAFVEQYGHYQLLNRYGPRNHNQTRLIGPFFKTATTFVEKDNFEIDFRFEPNYLYEFRNQLVKMKERDIKSFLTMESPRNYEPSFNDAILTRAEILNIWNLMDQNALKTKPLYNNPKSTGRGFGRLGLDLIDNENRTHEKPVNVLISKIQDDNFTRVYPGSVRMIHNLEPGLYNLIGIYDNKSYFKIDSLKVFGDGVTYHRLVTPKLNPPDSFSVRVTEIIVTTFKEPYSPKQNRQKEDLYEIKRVFNNSFGYSGPMKKIYGNITTDDNMPIPGVNVIVKGTTIGTTTDIDGNYVIEVPVGAQLVVSFIGLQSKELEVGNRSEIDINLEPDQMQLSEVVVTAQGIIRERRTLGYSVSTVTAADVQGHIPGLNVSSVSGTSGAGSLINIKIRGNSSISGMNTPLFIVDGVPQSTDPKLDPNIVQEITILKSLEATAIYGAQAANGVILITTNSMGRKSDVLLQTSLGALQGVEADEMSSIRSNFSDYAIWEPTLTTDENGLAQFDVTFPDDITSWNVYALAVGQKKTTGSTNTTIRSFKPVSANLAMTKFLIEGDSLNAIGKSLNYEGDSSFVSTEFILNNKIVGGQKSWLSTSVIDTLKISAFNTDTLELIYKLTRGTDDYFDGEQRSVPVYPQGVKEIEGQFFKLQNDSTIQLDFDSTKGPVKIYAESNLVNVVLNEINFVERYKYLCNEQTASKLKALLYLKNIDEYRGKKFRASIKVKKLIRRLERTQNKDGSWGWWADNSGQMWTTVHVFEALTLARKNGFHTNVDLERLMETAVYWLDTDGEAESRFFAQNDRSARLRLMKILADLKKPFDHARYLKPFHFDSTMTQVDYLRFTALKQTLGISVDLDSILSLKKPTNLGNYFWGEESANILENSIEASALAYDILSNSGKHDEELPHIRDYFLEQRKSGHWRNTYESVRVMGTVLNDILKANGSKPAELVLRGPVDKTIKDFPSEFSFEATSKLTVTKTGASSVYFSATQESWNKYPVADTALFDVKATFLQNGDTVKTLTAGTKVNYSVSVLVKKKAKHILLEIPIPAGTSYNSKPQRGTSVESGREYYEHSTSIFCEELTPGMHTFNIELLPRYSGIFHLNPVNVELMYFPTFKGRNQIEILEIK